MLNVAKMKELIVDFRKPWLEHIPLSISGRPVERAEEVRFLGVQTSKDLSWHKNISVITNRAQQRLQFLRRLCPLQHP